MADQPANDSAPLALADAPPVTPDVAGADGEPRRKKSKVRSAWISFVGRIVAQGVGASATFALALILVQSQQDTARLDNGSPARVEAAAVTPTVRERRDAEQIAVAVLPVESASSGGEDVTLAAAITDGIIAELSNTRGLRIGSRRSSSYYGKLDRPLAEIARDWNVEWIVEASLVTSKGRLRVLVQLIDAPADEHAWTRTYERELTDLLSIQSALAPVIAHDVAQVLRSQLTNLARTQRDTSSAAVAPALRRR